VTNPQSTIQSRHQQQFSKIMRVLLGAVLQAHTFCLTGSTVLLTNIFGAHFASYWILSHWIFDETCGSCMMVPQLISFTPPEITLRLPALSYG
jgi:hypothetical protein